jgi:hypothetical protein
MDYHTTSCVWKYHDGIVCGCGEIKVSDGKNEHLETYNLNDSRGSTSFYYYQCPSHEHEDDSDISVFNETTELRAK